MIYKISQAEIKEQELVHPSFFEPVTTQVHLLYLMLLLLAILIF